LVTQEKNKINNKKKITGKIRAIQGEIVPSIELSMSYLSSIQCCLSDSGEVLDEFELPDIEETDRLVKISD